LKGDILTAGNASGRIEELESSHERASPRNFKIAVAVIMVACYFDRCAWHAQCW
jgi:hypothetical protein